MLTASLDLKAPLTAAPRLDSPNHFLTRTASPWGMPGRVTSMAGPSTFGLSSLDPSMSSVWSRPTEETAAAATAAKEKFGDSATQENSLRGIADDYPSLMPSSAQDLPILDGETQQQTHERSRTATSGLIGEAERARQGGEDRASGYKNSRIVSAPSHPAAVGGPPGNRPRVPSFTTSASSRQNSFAYPSAYSHDGSIPSPYAVHASLPFSPVGMPSVSPYSPTVSHAQPAYALYPMAPYGQASTHAGVNGIVYQQVPAGIE